MTGTLLLPSPIPVAANLSRNRPLDLEPRHYTHAPPTPHTEATPATGPGARTGTMDAADAADDAGKYAVREQPLGTAKHVRVVSIGAGASGLNLIRALRSTLGDNYEHVVYEKNADVGGTWHESRYPGCRCDIPSHNYQFSWHPNRAWTGFFAGAEEIGAYLCRVCDEHDMRGAIQTQHAVEGAHWDEASAQWRLTVRNLATGTTFADAADFLVDGSGILNAWTWPDIPGLHDFRGDLVHSARWPDAFDYKDKTVVVVGNGASGVQIVPALQPHVKQLVHVVRTPAWILPPRVKIFAMGPAGEVLKDIDMDADEHFTPAQIARFEADPVFYRRFVKAIEKEVNNTFPILLKDGPVQAFAAQHVRQYMAAMLGGDADLCAKLIPTYPLGCRRMTPAPAYLPALRQPNVTLVTDGVRRVLSDAIELADGTTIPVDAIVCATGYDVSFRPRFPLVGRTGNLQDRWADEPAAAYMSVAVPGMPNYFRFLGPNAPIGHGSVFTLVEHIAAYIARAIQKCRTEGIRALAPSQAAVDDYSAHIRAFMPRTTWAAPCHSWFKGTDEAGGRHETGPVTGVHPGSRIHFFHMLATFRGEDYEYVYDGAVGGTPGNRFAYLGNGFSTKELDPACDSTWYLDGPALGTGDEKSVDTTDEAAAP